MNVHTSSVLNSHIVDIASLPVTIYRGNIGNIISHQSVKSTVGLSNSYSVTLECDVIISLSGKWQLVV